MTEALYLDDDLDGTGLETAAAYQHIIRRLKADPTITAAVGGRIVSELVPDPKRGKSNYPLILVQDTSDADSFEPNDNVYSTTVNVSVRLVTKTRIARNTAVLGAIHKALQDTDGDTDYGRVEDCARVEPANGAERGDDGQEYFYYGSVYGCMVT